ncbi:hypothetical protein BB560_003150 [Smittium megazygosporum]|uniref:Aerobactin siderophore biosynthesis IucA/IucC N-terminal domain-containing protein n=1 Tax=Smittium megazygosporum TaxID=133381 RepID=A0A2T9ZCX6_9FUNG|nr:hypothetical protein BB560_003150 [Smittium megazygosporum]
MASSTFDFIKHVAQLIFNLSAHPVEFKSNFLKAQYATASRVTTCFVNENAVSSFVYLYDPRDQNSENPFSFSFSDIFNFNNQSPASQSVVPLLILSPKPDSSSIESLQNNAPVLELDSTSPFFVFQLLKIPILDTQLSPNCFSVGLLDPTELSPSFWYFENSLTRSFHENDLDTFKVTDPIFLTKHICSWLKSSPEMTDQVCHELNSSVIHQEYRYDYPPSVPDLSNSKSIEWENTIVEGHAVHPVSRLLMLGNENIDVNTNFSNTRVVFISIERSKVSIAGDFDSEISPLLKSAKKSKDADPSISDNIYDLVDNEKYIIFPVHIQQLPTVVSLFKNEIEILPFEAKVKGQASLRTVSNEALEKSGKCMKLPIAIKVSSALRTVSAWSTHFGPRLGKIIPNIIEKNRAMCIENHLDCKEDALLIAKESSSVIYKSDDFDIGKHLSCVVRDEADALVDGKNEKVIICAALTETIPKDDQPIVVKLFGLDTLSKRKTFLQEYCDLYFEAFIPYILNFGFTFEAHQQNALLRVSASPPHKITGFIVRDFGGVKIYQPKLWSALQIFDDNFMLPDSFTDAESMEEVYKLAYHTMIQCNLYRLVRALDLHYSGIGWDIVRQSFEKIVPDPKNPLRKYWYQPKVNLKCFMLMKLDDLYRHYIYNSVSNILLFGKQN